MAYIGAYLGAEIDDAISELIGWVPVLTSDDVAGTGFTINSVSDNGDLNITRVGKTYPTGRVATNKLTYTKGSKYLVIAGDQTSVLSVTLDHTTNSGRMYRWVYETGSFSFIDMIGTGAKVASTTALIEAKWIGDRLIVQADGVEIVNADISSRSEPEWKNKCLGWVFAYDGVAATGCHAAVKTRFEMIEDSLDSIQAAPWSGLTWCSMGDSITFPGTYQAAVAESLGIATVENIGVSGSCVVSVDSNSMVNHYTAITGTPDLITVFGGTNDFGLDKTLGTIASTADTEFYGALKSLMTSLLTNHPTARIVFITPTHRDWLGGGQVAGLTNNNGDSLDDFCQAIRDVAALNSIPVIDLYKEWGVSLTNITSFTSDRLHPNAAGYARMAKIIASKLKLAPL